MYLITNFGSLNTYCATWLEAFGVCVCRVGERSAGGFNLKFWKIKKYLEFYPHDHSESQRRVIWEWLEFRIGLLSSILKAYWHFFKSLGRFCIFLTHIIHQKSSASRIIKFTCYPWECRSCCSVAQLCPTLCEPMNWNVSGFPVLHHLLELSKIHVHWVSDAIQPSHPLSSLSPPAFSLLASESFQWVSCSHQVARVLDLQL